MFTVNKKLILKQFSIVSLILVCASFYTQYEADAEEATQTIGVLCCAVTVVFFAAPFTMLQHVFRVKNCESLPFPLILATFIVSLEWFVYGVMIDDTFIQVISIGRLMITYFIDFVLCVCVCRFPMCWVVYWLVASCCSYSIQINRNTAGQCIDCLIKQLFK